MKRDKDVEMRQLAANMFEIEANLMEKIAKLENDLVRGWERNRESERKNEDLEAQLSDQNVEVRKGKAKIGELEGKIDALQSKISGFETQIECEQKERSDEFTKINSKISQNDVQSTKIGADLKEIDSKVAEMSKIISMKMAQIEADLMGEKAKLEADLVDERERNQELERKIAETERKNDDLEAQLRTQNAEVRDGKIKIGELEGKINALQSKISGFETQINRTMNLLNLYRDGWSYLAKTASWYKAIDQRMTFDEAEAYCASRKIHLVSILRQEENDFVSKLAKTVDPVDRFWIGLKRNPDKGNAFEWTDGSSVDFINWKVVEPDSNTHAYLWSGHGKWSLWPRTSQFRFICKRSSQF